MSRMTGINFNTIPAMRGMPDVFCLFPVNPSRFALPTSSKRLTEVKSPINQAKTFTYDKKGNLTGVTDAKGVTISFDYDVMDRLTVKHLPEGDVSYTYDVVGNLLSVTSPEGQLTFAYDALNRVTQTTQRFPLYASPYTLAYAYDANGNRTQMTSPWGATSYTYDALNRLTSLTNPDAKTVTFAYDAAGKRTRMTYPNGTETTYAYDAASQLTQILHRKTADNTALAFSNYAYDPAGNRTQMQDLTGTHTYGYDDLHRLTSASHPSLPDETFAYDQVGNRTQDAVVTNYQHNAANRLLENSSYTYTYDANGNLTGQTHKVTSEHTEYAYTTENQLKQVTLPDNTTVAFKYDPLGRRIEKTSTSGATRYVCDNEDIIATLDANNAQKQAYTHGPGIDEPLILKNTSTQANYYYHADGLGSITALSDTNGAIVETVEYQAYGKPVFKDAQGTIIPNSAIDNIYSYTGREYDPETGLLNYRFRQVYDVETGRFAQDDPVGFIGGINFTAYADNSPTNYIDPFGLSYAVYNDLTQRLLFYGNDNKFLFHCQASNNVVSGASKWPGGVFDFSYHKPHFPNPNGPFGEFGNFVFDVPGRPGMGIHSGRANTGGWQEETEGCIRTTNKCASAVDVLHSKDPLRYIKVR